MSQALLELVRRYTDTHPGGNPWMTAIENVGILRSDLPRRPSPLLFQPSLCVVAQGTKWSTFGNRRYEYGAGQALVVSVEMPAFSRVAAASPDEPFLGVVIGLDPKLITAVMETLPAPVKVSSHVPRGVFVTDYDGPLADCVIRLLRLLDTPQAIPHVAPLVLREIAYWLLSGPHAADVAKVALADNRTHRVLTAVHTLRAKFTEAMSIDELAAIAQLSPSAFHRQFKALTSMTPLQFQKQLRLLEARHLLASGEANAETAAWRVGYESASQFSREYARMFGAPPRRDAAALREPLPG
ncbi:AraC family transcriptional regulator [Luteibacter aegosomatissinici]|uniref:AraC family transcriptional regulator n=1 Tax=Luteibacter aegosomatissinici TaxID=2911539 RepID=UPI001FFBBE99|nr:AraC family transcriptional regulator [Luteibacter aegosomatissinici]UPG95887.1 AraC family transcriptional regulator [Luteibacter aegosomatissinici]